MVDQHLQYHLDRLTDKKIFTVTSSDLILDQILTYINTCSDDYDIIVIDFATNYTRDAIEESICEQLSQHILPKPWIIITSDFKYFNQQHNHIIYYPIYLIDGLDKCSDTEIEIKNLRTHNICFLTYHYHWHRVLIMLDLYKRMNFESCLVNLPKLTTLHNSQQQSLTSTLSSLTIDERQLVDEMFKLAPLNSDPTDKQREIVDINNRAFRDSYINLFTESDYPRPFVTEKSVKPFLSGQLFAIIAHPSAYLHLKELGFDLFEDYLPIPQHADFRQYIQELMNTITNLIPNLELVWNDTHHRRLHNYTLARSSELRNNLRSQLRIKLNSI